MRLPHHALLVLLTVTATLVGCSSGAADQPGAAPGGAATAADPYAPYAALTGPDRTAKLLADARAEGGEVDVYTSNTDIQPLVDGFQQVYPGVHVNAFRANSEDAVFGDWQAERFNAFVAPQAG